MTKDAILFGVIVIFISNIKSTLEVSLGGEALYGPNDRITLLNNTNFKDVIVGSDRAWIVEFYSSWCGHCIHFAPTFKLFANDVYGWRDVISVAAIDCAQDINSPICREYEVMGYPTLRFFPPKAAADFKGQDMRERVMTMEGIKTSMLNYVEDLLNNKTAGTEKWPNILPFSGEKLEDLWLESREFYALLLVEAPDSDIGRSVILDLQYSLAKLNIPLQLRRSIMHSNSSGFITKQKDVPAILSLNKDNTFHTQLKFGEYTREAWYSAIKDFIWSKSKEFSLTGKELEDKKDLNPGGDAKLQGPPPSAEKLNSKKDLITRRYKVFLSDLEKAMVYSLSHEVGQHGSIAGEALVALQKYITVLDAYFPSRPEVEVFLSELHVWIHAHQDVVRGEDLVDKINSFVGDHGVRVNPAWVGCQGSKPMYGGYPCGLWSLWHALTISQAEVGSGEASDVLVAMQGFIKNFFGCTECARHFDQAIQQGQGIQENVKTHKDSVLYLWNIHNRVNVRLQGDTSEDPAFPKLVFPEKRFCAKCYNDATGSDLWHEFEREEVYSFLRGLFAPNKISKQGLIGDEVGRLETHEGVGEASNLKENLETLDLDNYREKSSKAATTLIFFNGADISLCLVLWLSSAALILFLYLKFVMHRRLSNAAIMSLLKRKTSYNPLVGKV